jgi:hypothetical protein
MRLTNTIKAYSIAMLTVASTSMVISCSSPVGEDNTSTQKPAATIALSAMKSSASALAKTQSPTASIESFKICITTVLLAEDVIMNGTAASFTKTLSLYAGPIGSQYYPQFNADSARKSDIGFIDFTNSASLENLTGTAVINEEIGMIDSVRKADSILTGHIDTTSVADLDTFIHAGIYRYIYVGFMKPFKITGSALSITGDTYYTKDGTMDFVNNEYTSTISEKLLTEAPAEEAVVMKNNGGTLFKLLRPLVVTKQDVYDSTIFRVLLVFNPNGFLSAYDSRLTNGGEGGIADTTGKTIKVPFLDVVPIAYRDGQTVIQETYLISDVGQSIYTQLELCTVNEDSANIYGANIRGVTMNASQLPQEYQKIVTVDEVNGKITFKDMNGTIIADNFTRTVSGTMDIYYGSNKSAGVSYTLTDKKSIN